MPGAWSLSAYYGGSDFPLTISKLIPASQQDYYPVAPLIIDGAQYTYTTGLTFDNNAMQELTQSPVTNYYPSNAITIRRSQGDFSLNSLTIQNYAGFDLVKLSSILETGASNFQTATPIERDNTGLPNSPSTSPKYTIDFGFKNRLIRLAYPTSNTDTDFRNYFDTFKIDILTLKNITQYDPSSLTPLFSQFSDDWTDLAISNFDIQLTNAIKSQLPIFAIQNYGSLSITNGTISNINQVAYSYSTSDYLYVGSNGVVFSLSSVQLDNSYPAFISTISNITFDKIYSREGGAFYFVFSSNAQNAQSNTVTMDKITIKNSFSYSNGMMYFYSGKQFVSITNSIFFIKYWKKGEADLKAKKVWFFNHY